MNSYKVQWNYSSTLNNQAISLAKGQTIWLSKEAADTINRDSPGILVKQAKQGIPHTHRMVTAEHVTGLRDISTITESEEEPKPPEPPITPAARKLAETHGLDLSAIAFAGDKIVVADVKTAVGSQEQGEAQPQVKHAATKSGKSH